MKIFLRSYIALQFKQYNNNYIHTQISTDENMSFTRRIHCIYLFLFLGAFGSVHKAKLRGEEVAVKILTGEYNNIILHLRNSSMMYMHRKNVLQCIRVSEGDNITLYITHKRPKSSKCSVSGGGLHPVVSK